MDLQDRIEQSLYDWLATFQSKDTRRSYLKAVQQLNDFISKSGKTLADMSRQDLEKYQLFISMTLKPASVNSRMSAVVSYYNYVQRANLFDVNMNTSDVKRFKTSSIPTKALTLVEQSKLVDAAKVSRYSFRDSYLVLTLLSTGMRVSELCRLSIADVSTSGGHLQVTIRGKGNKFRVNPLPTIKEKQQSPATPEKESSITKLPVDEPFIKDNKGGWLNRDKVQTILTRLSKAAGLSFKVTPHMLRASMITTSLVDLSQDLYLIQDLVGHTSPDTTDSYRRRSANSKRSQRVVNLIADNIS